MIVLEDALWLGYKLLRLGFQLYGALLSPRRSSGPVRGARGWVPKAHPKRRDEEAQARDEVHTVQTSVRSFGSWTFDFNDIDATFWATRPRDRIELLSG